MSDERLRSAARGAGRDPDDEGRWLVEALRAGRLSAAQVRAAAVLGHRAARRHVEAGASGRPRWEFPELPPWRPLVEGQETLTERIEAAGPAGARDVLVGAAAEVALGRLDLGPASELEVTSLPFHHAPHAPRALRAPGGGCLARRWLAALLFDRDRIEPADAHAVAERLRHSTWRPLAAGESTSWLLPSAPVRRGWVFEVRGPWSEAVEAADGISVVAALTSGGHDGDDLSSAWTWHHAGFHARALRRLEARVADEDDDPRDAVQVEQLRARCLVALGDVGGADEALGDAIARSPEVVEHRVERARLRWRADDPGGAADDYAHAVELAERPALRADLLSEAGRLELERDDPRAAIPLLEQAVAIRGDSAARAHLAEARRRTGDHAGALAECEAALARLRDHPHALLERGRTRSAMGDREGAISDFTRAIEVSGPRPMPAALCNRGATRLVAGDEGGLEDLDAAIAADPTRGWSWLTRGRERRQRGDLKGSRADLDRAVALMPSSVEALEERAWTLHELGEYLLAIDDCEAILRMSPDRASAFVNRGRARKEAGQVDLALADYARALELDPRRVMARNNMADIHLEQGDLLAARSALTSALAIDPDHFLARLNLGRVLVRAGDLEAARATLAGPAPRWATAPNLRLRARTRRDAGDLEGALLDALAATKLQPDCADGHVLVASLLERVGRMDEARAACAEALRRAPAYADALALCARLGEPV